jgi:DNA-binding LytR/AlgR family response regulator
MRVLIVNDEPLARSALAQILTERADVERFDSANDAIEAQERLAKEDYDVMLLDVSMPERSGLELLNRLQHCERALPSVVFVIAHAEHALAAFDDTQSITS